MQLHSAVLISKEVRLFLNLESEFNRIHGEKYDYSFVKYMNEYAAIKIICPVHGKYNQSPKDHLIGYGCPTCEHDVNQHNSKYFKKHKKPMRLNTSVTEPSSITRFHRLEGDFRGVYGNKYDYYLVDYRGMNLKVKIICPEHGIFKHSPAYHLRGNGCVKCSREKQSKIQKKIESPKKMILDPSVKHPITVRRFQTLEAAFRKVHGDKFGYGESVYKSAHIAIKIKCPIHGVFNQLPTNHLKGCGCPKCSYSKKPTTQMILDPSVKHKNAAQCTEEKTVKPIESSIGSDGIDWNKKSLEKFIEDSVSVHGDKYDYSKVKYKNNYKAVEIICPKHGVFEQLPINHLKGDGCLKCS